MPTPKTTEKKSPAADASQQDELAKLRGCWRDVIDQVAKADPLSKRLFIDTAPIKIAQAHLTIGVDPEFSSEVRQMKNPRASMALSKAVGRVFGRQFSVSYQPLSVEDKRSLPTDNPAKDQQKADESNLTGIRKWYTNPVVKTVVEVFNGEILDVRE